MFFFSLSLNTSVRWILPPKLVSKIIRPLHRDIVYSRKDLNWRPFRDALSPESNDYAFLILKGMFKYFVDTKYMTISPMAVGMPKMAVSKPIGRNETNRSLDTESWAFIIEAIDVELGASSAGKTDRKYQKDISTWTQYKVIFSLFYLLGVRISELANMKMSDFYYGSRNGRTRWWLDIVGKGSKLRTIPVPNEARALIAEYRRYINAAKNNDHPASVGEEGDLSYVLLRPNGTSKKYTGSGLHYIVKTALSHIVANENTYHDIRAGRGLPPLTVNIRKLKEMSSHWIRHTTASHNVDQMGLVYLQKLLGHVSITTTQIYLHHDNDAWSDSVEGLSVRSAGSITKGS
jgi:integrase/recombinase XerD